jgi:hypothetical protein
MNAGFGWSAGFVAAFLASDGVAQQTVDGVPESSAQAQSKPVDAKPTESGTTDDASPPVIEGLDGQAIPPEVQRELEEAIKKKAGELTPEAIEKIAPEAVKRSNTGDIIVTGQRPRGAVISDVRPERTLNAVDIKASGATTVAELLNVLGPQLDSDRGRGNGGPVVLLNGKRVTNFLEIARLPTEAIERTEVFPEDVALSYGFSAGQKVVNIVTYENFKTQIGALSFGGPTEGGRNTLGLTTDFLRIRGDTRINIDGSYERSGNVLENERKLDQLPDAQNQGQFRTLLPRNERYTINGALSRPLVDDILFTLNGRFAAVNDEALVGLGRAGALTRDADTRAGRIGTSLSGLAGKWLWTFTGGYNFDRSNTVTDNQLSGRDQGRSKTETLSADLLLNGAPFTLPAGPVVTSIRSGFELRDFSSRSAIGSAVQQSRIDRDQASVQASVDLPIIGSRSEISSTLGQLSVNVNADITSLSDFGRLNSFGYGLNWSPLSSLNILASVVNEDGAPTLEQLGAPVVITPNANIFDFVRGQTVDVVRVTGGNAELRKDDRRVISIAAFAAPFSKADLKFRLNYTDIRTNDPIFPFPIATQAVQAAFPERFQRDGNGQLARIDSRAVNFKSATQRQIRWGVDFTRTLDKVPPWLRNAKITGLPTGGSPSTANRPDRVTIKAEPGSALAKGVESLTSRLTFSFSHVWRLEDSVVLQNRTDELNLLNGAALDQRGGRSRHEIEFQAGAFKRGAGARITARWQSKTFIRGLPPEADGGAGDLRFSQPLILNINLFANLDERLKGKTAEFFKASRLSLSFSNILNNRTKVRDEAGLTPLNYQSAFFDPLGRAITLGFRKRF